MGKRKHEPVMRTMPPSERIHELLSHFDSTSRYLVAMATQSDMLAAKHGDGTIAITPGPHISVELWGGHHPTVFTTLRNAVRTATEHPSWAVDVAQPGRARMLESYRPTYGFVLQLDLASLPVVDLANPQAVVFEDMNELAFAERQADWWALRAATLAKTGKYG